MKNQVIFLCPFGLTIDVAGVQNEIMYLLNKRLAHTVPTQVLVFQATQGTAEADEIMVLCFNAAVIDENRIVFAVQDALTTKHPDLSEKRIFNFHLLHLPRGTKQ